jgi:hypothetical protein
MAVYKGNLSEAQSGYKKGAHVICLDNQKMMCLCRDIHDENWGYILDTSGITIDMCKKPIKDMSDDVFYATYDYISRYKLVLPKDHIFR